MNKFESLNENKFQKLNSNEMSTINGGAKLWHTWLTGKTKHTSSSTGITYGDSMVEGEEEVDFGDQR